MGCSRLIESHKNLQKFHKNFTKVSQKFHKSFFSTHFLNQNKTNLSGQLLMHFQSLLFGYLTTTHWSGGE